MVWRLMSSNSTRFKSKILTILTQKRIGYWMCGSGLNQEPSQLLSRFQSNQQNCLERVGWSGCCMHLRLKCSNAILPFVVLADGVGSSQHCQRNLVDLSSSRPA